MQDLEKLARLHLRQGLASLEDREASFELRTYARCVVSLSVNHLADERALTDVLVVLRRAVDRRDMLPLALVSELPQVLRDGQDACAAALLPLGDHAVAVGAIDPLIEIANGALAYRWLDVPATWIRAVLEAEDGPELRECVNDLVNLWAMRPETDVKELAEVLRRRPGLYEKLGWSHDDPF